MLNSPPELQPNQGPRWQVLRAEAEVLDASRERALATVRALPELRPNRGPRWRVLRAEAEVLYASRGLDLFLSRDGGHSFELRARSTQPWLDRLIARTPMLERLTRSGLHGVTVGVDGALTAIARGAILHCGAASDVFELVHRIERGSRPLNLCRAPSGRIYFGEYFGNAAREEVHLYGSDDGTQFDVAYTFSRGAIRHVHGIVFDPHRQGLWVMTGDDGEEAGLWWSDDELRSLTPVARGSQAARAVQVLPTERGLIVPSDTPEERNWIRLFDPETARFEDLEPLPGSAFSAGRAGALHVVSTAIEPSEVNRDPWVHVYVSLCGETWQPLAKFERDLALLNDVRGRLLYPLVRLPEGPGSNDTLVATGQALKGLHGRLMSWDVAAVRALLQYQPAELTTARRAATRSHAAA